MPLKKTKLAIITTHPIQYYAPWFAHLAATVQFDIRVYYLWDGGIHNKHDPGFNQEVKWDIPLLEGYQYEFVVNTSKTPGTNSFLGIKNRGLIRKIYSFAPDVILLVGYNYYEMIKVILWGRMRKIPLMLRGDSHILLNHNSIKYKLKSLLRSLIFSRFEKVLFVGKSNREYYRRQGVPANKLEFAPHAIDTIRFEQFQGDSLRERLGISREKKVFLFVGKFVEKKWPDKLLSTFKSITNENVVLIFVGAGPLEEKMKRLAANNSNIYFHPFVNQREMPSVYNSVDLIILPSYGPYETWGLVINEAMTLSVPALVSTHVGCQKDLVIPQKTGLVFKAGDIEDLRAKLKVAMTSDQLLKWGINARKLIQRYSYDEATKGLCRAIEKLH